MNEEDTCFYNNIRKQPTLLRNLTFSRIRSHNECIRGDLAQFGMWPCGVSWSLMTRDLFGSEAFDVGLRIPSLQDKITKLIVEGFSCAGSTSEILDPSVTPRCIGVWRKLERLMKDKDNSEQHLQRLVDEPLDSSQKLNPAELPGLIEFYHWDSGLATTEDQKSRWERATNCVSKMWQPNSRVELLCAGLFDHFMESALEDDPDWGYHFREMKQLNCVMNPAKPECIARRESVTKKVMHLKWLTHQP